MLKEDKNKTHVYKYIRKALKDTTKLINVVIFVKEHGFKVCRQGYYSIYLLFA